MARGGTAGEVTDLALWAVPFGVVGGRLYHVITDHDLYFGAGKHADRRALRLARRPRHLGRDRARRRSASGSAPGARGSGCRRCSTRWRPACWSPRRSAAGATGSTRSCSAGRPTLPWALKIDPPHRPPGYEQYATFQPTFLYESLWDLGAFGFVLWADRRFKLGHGRVMALYVMAYTAGRGWIEMLRIDNVEYKHVLGLRLNVWTSIVLFVLAAVYFVSSAAAAPAARPRSYTEKRARRRPSRRPPEQPGDRPDGRPATGSGTRPGLHAGPLSGLIPCRWRGPELSPSRAARPIRRVIAPEPDIDVATCWRLAGACRSAASVPTGSPVRRHRDAVERPCPLSTKVPGGRRTGLVACPALGQWRPLPRASLRLGHAVASTLARRRTTT